MEFTLTINPNADQDLFEHWLAENYPNYDGISTSDSESFITVYLTSFTTLERDAITSYYNGLTVNESISQVSCQVYKYMELANDYDKTTPPKEFDYIRSLGIRLNPVITNVYKGEVREITYYETVVLNADGSQTGDTPVIREQFTYVRDASLLPISRTLEIFWVLENGADNSDTKMRMKYYTSEQKIAEGQRRRRNIIDFMQIPVIGMIAATEGVTVDEAITLGAAFFDTYTTEVSSYVYTPRSGTLQSVIIADTTTWLDNIIGAAPVSTIRDYILDQLNY